ncbi:MAG: XTP/dITP diphosphatase [Nitrososphaeria archaeon]
MLPQIKRKLFFATDNQHKILEAQQILSEFEITVEKIQTRKIEIQANELEDVVSFALKQIETGNMPIVVEDSGLFIDKLNGFPGPYSSFVFKKIGCDGILKLMEGEHQRDARFVSVVGYKDNERETIFKGEIRGTISLNKIGESGFGFDPIFIPEGSTQTFAEMEMSEKNRLSHRGRTLRALGKWLQMTKYI